MTNPFEQLNQHRKLERDEFKLTRRETFAISILNGLLSLDREGNQPLLCELAIDYADMLIRKLDERPS